MARSDINTVIPLDRAAQILGINPYHFNTIETSLNPINHTVDCSDEWFQKPHQRYGAASRDDLARALNQAEKQVFKYLGYAPVPIWIEQEEHRVRKPYDVQHRNFAGINARGQRKSIETNYGYVVSTGTKTKTLIDDAAAITYSDADGDGYNELATVTVSTTVTEAQEIHAYFPGKSGLDTWEIRPIDVSISGGIATITFQKYLVPLPDLWVIGPTEDDPRWRTINGDSSGNFLTTVDVYRVYNDPSVQATFYYEGELCGDGVDNVTGFDTETGMLRIRDSRLGLLAYEQATWDSTNERFTSTSSCHQGDPDKILISYRAGTINRDNKYPYLEMDASWEMAIVYFAYSKLDRATNMCNNLNSIHEQMSEDLSLVSSGGGSSTSYNVSFKDLQNPLGTSRAAIKLWRMIEQERLV